MISQLISSFYLRLLVYTTCFIFLLFSTRITLANTPDSLLSTLKTHRQDDTIKVNLLTSLSTIYINENIDSAINFANEGLSIAQKINYEKGAVLSMQALGLAYLNKNEYDKSLGYYTSALESIRKSGSTAQNGIALIYFYMGSVYTHETKQEEAIDYFKKSLDLSRQINDHGTEGLALTGIGNLYNDIGNYTEALKFHLDALKIFEKENDISGLSTCLNNIATIYSTLGDYKRSLDYNKQSHDLFVKTGNKQGILSSYLNSGVVYGEMNDFRNALGMFSKGVALADSIGDKYWKDICLANVGEAYYRLESYDTAYAQYTLSLNEAQKMNDEANIAQSENGLGSILLKKGKPAEAIKHLLRAYDIMVNARMKGPLQEISMNISEAYEKAHDFTSALKYYKIYAAYSDSLSHETNNKRIQQLQFDYELGKKETQINLLQKDKVIADNKNEKELAIIWASCIVLVFLIIVTTQLYRSRSFEKRSKEEILKQKEEIQLQAVKLTELNKFKDKTFSVLSHDLRGPIDSFYSIIKLLDEKTISTDEYMKLKPEMTAQIASLTILLDNLLKWAASNIKGHMTPKPVNTNIHSIAHQNINLLQSPANRKQITLNNEIPDPMFTFCDPAQIDIVIRNLIMNAIKFTKHKGTVTLSAKNDNNNVYISIADNGVGMTKEQLDKLFIITPDNHTYGTDGETGTGLGLLLCYEFIKTNNGSVSVSSEKNKGSIFTITLKKAAS